VTQPGQSDYFANHAKARKFPWTLYHRPLERDLARFLADVHGTVLVVGCGLLHELDVAPPGVQFVVADVDARAVDEWSEQPLAQQARPHGGHGAVQNGEQGAGRVRTAQ